MGVATGSTLSEWYQQIAKDDPTGLSSFLPGGGGWRYYTVTGDFPSRTHAEYTLKVGGLVDRPFTLTYDELTAHAPDPARPRLPVRHRLAGAPTSSGRASAWPTSSTAPACRPRARRSGSRCFDGEYTESLTLEQARRPDVIVAYELDGTPIGSDHGGPVRLYVAPMYGYKSAKWLDGIEVTRKVIPGYWEERGYDVDAWVGDSNGRNDEQT